MIFKNNGSSRKWESAFIHPYLGGVYMIPDRVSFRYDFIPVPY